MKSSISGFPELSPNEQIVFNRAIGIIATQFELHGFVPMDTAAVERIETLLSKGNDSEIYGLYRISDSTYKKDLGLRFDLTVPLARYISENSGQLVFPHKRYQISPVWRGERPQYGRYRQFYQCDIDIVGDGELSLEHDVEVISLVASALNALGAPKFHTQINNRKILSGFLSDFVEPNKIVYVIQAIDKIDKISSCEFDSMMSNIGLSAEHIKKTRNFINIDKQENNDDILNTLKNININTEFNAGVSELETTLRLLKKIGTVANITKISLKLARGLTYYTGNIFETTIDNYTDIGSISGGGRYENLTNTITKSSKRFPGVGASIGISRLIPKLIETGVMNAEKLSTADILVTSQNRNFLSEYIKIASKLRKGGIKAEIYLHNKPLGSQLSYASKKGINLVLIANEVELLNGEAIVRNLHTKEQQLVRMASLCSDVNELLS